MKRNPDLWNLFETSRYLAAQGDDQREGKLRASRGVSKKGRRGFGIRFLKAPGNSSSFEVGEGGRPRSALAARGFAEKKINKPGNRKEGPGSVKRGRGRTG